MNEVETVQLLEYANQIDPRVEVTDAAVTFWHEALGHFTFEEAARGLQRHYAQSTERVFPAHVRSMVNGAPDAGREARRRTCHGCGRVHREMDGCNTLITLVEYERRQGRTFAEIAADWRSHFREQDARGAALAAPSGTRMDATARGDGVAAQEEGAHG